MRTLWFALAAMGSCMAVLLGGCRESTGGQSGDEGTDRVQPPTGSGGTVLVPGCKRLEAYGPDGPGRLYLCRSQDDRYASGEIAWTGGPSTPPGPYECDCPDQRGVTIADAESCDDALLRACRFDPEGPVACAPASAPERGGVCWPVLGAPGNWRCNCSTGADLVPVENATCEEAWFRACSSTCSTAFGDCELSAGGSEYTCGCSDGSMAVWPVAVDCMQSLDLGCRSECEGSRGTCSRRYDGFQCNCGGSGDSPTFVGHDQAYGDCDLALEVACGAPPVGESCSPEDWQGARCVADGAGAWACTCAESSSCLRPMQGLSVPHRALFPGEENLPPPPAGLLERPRSCISALESVCGCE